jgi:lysophospholipid acyltransferase (LPLAT)-like uncharacterized protein
MLKKLVEKPAFRRFVAGFIAAYFRLVNRTCRRIQEPADFFERHGPRGLIATTWHGEHFMFPFVAPKKSWKLAAMISRSRDGDLNALVAEKLGAQTIRASGGRDAAEVARRGGVRGFVEAVRMLREGYAITITADVPKVGKVAGEGIVQIARRAGVPIVPIAAVTSRRKRMIRSWDRAAFNLPFGRFVVVLGEPIEIPEDADEATIETKRRELGETLDRLFRRAYEIAGGKDA